MVAAVYQVVWPTQQVSILLEIGKNTILEGALLLFRGGEPSYFNGWFPLGSNSFGYAEWSIEQKVELWEKKMLFNLSF